MGKVVLLTNDRYRARVVANAIHETVPLSGIVVQMPRPRARLPFPKEVLFRVLGPERYDALARLRRPRLEREVARLERRLEREAEAFFRRRCGQREAPFPPGVPRIETPDINGPTCFDFLTRENPDLILVYGTSILQPHILETAKIGALNAHTSILPDYRGSKVEFWQILQDDLDKAGITIHFVDPTVDTGAIVYQRRAEVPPRVDHFLLRMYNTLYVMEDYGRVARDVLEGRAEPRPQGPTSHPTYRFRDITLEKKIAYYKKLGYLN